MTAISIDNCFNEITRYSQQEKYEEEIAKEEDDLRNITSSFYDIFYGVRRIIYNLHKRETIKMYMTTQFMSMEYAIHEYASNYITEEQFVFYRKHFDE